MNAVYALLDVQGADLGIAPADEVRVLSPRGRELMRLNAADSELSMLGSVSASVEGKVLNSGVGAVVVNKAADRPSAWGAAYAQFLLPLSEVGTQAEGMRIRCEVSNARPAVGDRVVLRYIITSDKDYDYVCLKAGRAACLEPVNAVTGYEYSGGLGYYKEVRDASTNYFFERLPKGTFVLEAEYFVERPGTYSAGAVKLNGVYSPEFAAYGSVPSLEVRP